MNIKIGISDNVSRFVQEFIQRSRTRQKRAVEANPWLLTEEQCLKDYLFTER